MDENIIGAPKCEIIFSRFTWYCTHTGLHLFLKIGFVVDLDMFYSYYIHQENKSDKEKRIAKKS